jgi:hypothetical protein
LSACVYSAMRRTVFLLSLLYCAEEAITCDLLPLVSPSTTCARVLSAAEQVPLSAAVSTYGTSFCTESCVHLKMAAWEVVSAVPQSLNSFCGGSS